ncbi:MAG: hypothetical protein ACI81O_000229 [Cyclobacteriaceae bacterium]|jgi:hypothetical protein
MSFGGAQARNVERRGVRSGVPPGVLVSGLLHAC